MDLLFEFDNVRSGVKPARNPNRIKAFLETYKQIEDISCEASLLVSSHRTIHLVV
jgi:hypothetical protein